MRIHKIALRNYRGVSDRTVEFAPGGVTIVEGPNEIGKSSLAEAIDRIIEDLDSTSRQRILAVKPVDRDVGPEVMIEAETGPYAFRYRKRFIRDRVTELEILRPRPENHTGREAHERVLAILSETVDMALWKALRMQQGDTVGQATLVEQTSLSAALDRSAGESPAGEEEMTLFDVARAEYLQYWTETGRRKQAAAEMERTIERATQEIAQIEDAIRAIEDDVEASVRLEAEARRRVERRTEQRSRLGQFQDRVDLLAKLEAGVETIRARFDSARLAANEATRVEKARQDAISAVAAAKSTQERLDAEVQEGGPQLEVAQARVAAADLAVSDARTAREAAKAHAEERQGRLSQLRDLADLASLLDRSERRWRGSRCPAGCRGRCRDPGRCDVAGVPPGSASNRGAGARSARGDPPARTRRGARGSSRRRRRAGGDAARWHPAGTPRGSVARAHAARRGVSLGRRRSGGRPDHHGA